MVFRWGAETHAGSGAEDMVSNAGRKAGAEYNWMPCALQASKSTPPGNEAIINDSRVPVHEATRPTSKTMDGEMN